MQESTRANETRYQATVPDTLDLAERAALSVNALTGAADPQADYETYHGGHIDHRIPYMSHNTGGPCVSKAVVALQMMRLMSGSTQNADYDARMLEHCLKDVEDDGLYWLKIEGRPWRNMYAHIYGPGDFVCIPSHALVMIALLDLHRCDGDPRWLEMVGRMSDGLAGLASVNQDRAWFSGTYYHRQGWQEDLTPSVLLTGDAKKPSLVEPAGADIYTTGYALQAFSRWYAASGDSRALDMAGRLARTMLKPASWPGTGEGPTMVAQGEQGMWHGHFHSMTMGMKGLAEYAIATNDAQARRRTIGFYEYARYYGYSRIGFFYADTGPLQGMREKYLKNYGEFLGMPCEGCDVGDMTWLAARLSESGIGDYWEDVDQYVRNHLIEHQWVRRDLIEECAKAGPERAINPDRETDEDVIERNIGAFSAGTDLTRSYGWWTMCCNANIPIGMFKAWEGIVQGPGDAVQVNLLLNRASRWLDVDSHLPYEGKVVLKNKTARKVHVRIPRWVDRREVCCCVNDRKCSSEWVSNYLTVEGLSPQDTVIIEFPVVETVEKHTDIVSGIEYTCHFKGNTLVDITPRAEGLSRTMDASDDGGKFWPGKGYPLYLRDGYKARQAPLKTVERYVAPKVI